MTRAAKLLRATSALVVAAALLATLAWAVLTIAVRPLDGVEGDVLFEAARARAGLSLWVDPAVGARDYGDVPARYYVLYPPLWSALLSLAPESAAPIVSRVLGGAAWLSVLGAAVATARPSSGRVAAWLAAFAAGAWVLSFYGMSGRPDGVAVGVAGFALLRSVKRGRVDALAGALFVLAAWVKPNVIGAAPGALVGTVIAAWPSNRAPGRALREVVPAIAAGAGTAVVVAAVLTDASGGAWVTHLLASTGQAPSIALWWQQIASRAPFFALPVAFALVTGLRAARDVDVDAATRRSAVVGAAALATSAAWCVLSLAKIGSAANYFLEVYVAVVVLVANVPARVPRSRHAELTLAALALAQAAWTGVAAVRSSVEGITLARERRALLDEVRATCGIASRPGALVAADEPGLELEVNGRILQTPFQSTHLAARGAFPLEAWLADLAHPDVACLVLQDDLLERPLEVRSREHDRFGPEVRAKLRARFELVATRAGWHVYRAR